MELNKQVEGILSRLDIKDNTIIKPKYRDCRELTAQEVIKAGLLYKTVEETSKHLGISPSTFKRMMTKQFPNKSLSGKKTYRFFFLSLIELKDCFSCNQTKSFDEFYKDSRNSNEVGSYCKTCNIEKRLQHQKDRPDIARASSAKRRALLTNSMPSWANLEEIAKIYLLCPEGCHVDHEVPLQGSNVCGLHVEYNLQYLTAEENLKKGNKLREEQ